MGASKVIVDGETIVDLTEDTATPETVAAGETFHDANGDPQVGTMTTAPVVQTTGDSDTSVMSQMAVTEALGEKVDAEEGMGLSHNDYTDEEKQKVAQAQTDSAEAKQRAEAAEENAANAQAAAEAAQEAAEAASTEAGQKATEAAEANDAAQTAKGEAQTAADNAAAAKAEVERKLANGEFDGESVTVASVTESTESGGENVVEFSDGKTLTVRNGKDGVDWRVTTFIGKTASFYGDSLTEQTTHSYTKGYHAWVSEILGLESYVNYGVSGYRIYDVYTKVNSVSDTSDIIFLMCGVNDQTYSVPLGVMGDTDDDTTYGALDMLCSLLRRKYPTKLIVFITPHYQTRYPHKGGITSYEVAKAIKDVCEKYAIPVYDNFIMSGIYPSNLYLYTGDGCHWNNTAHEMVGKHLAQYMANTFGYIYDAQGAHTHSYMTVNTVPATCTSMGYTEYSCACGASYKDTFVDMLDHNYVDGECSMCGDVHVEGNLAQPFLTDGSPNPDWYVGHEIAGDAKVFDRNSSTVDVSNKIEYKVGDVITIRNARIRYSPTGEGRVGFYTLDGKVSGWGVAQVSSLMIDGNIVQSGDAITFTITADMLTKYHINDQHGYLRFQIKAIDDSTTLDRSRVIILRNINGENADAWA